MLDQLLSIGLAILLFLLIVWVPGILIGYVTNVLAFRSRPAPIQVALGLLLSLTFTPIVTYLLARAGGFPAAFGLYGVIWAVAAGMALRHLRPLLAGGADLVLQNKLLIALVVVWISVGAFSEIDIPTAGGVMRSLNAGDATAHVAFTNALTRTGIPPVNPFIYPGYGVQLFYYYFWYMMCSLVDQLGGALVDSRAAVQAGMIYAGFALFSLVAVCVEIWGAILLPFRKPRISVAIFLLTLTGLDLLPWIFEHVLFTVFGKGPGAGLSIEWWNEQVTAWFGALLMSPHHPVATAVCFTALILLLDAVKKQSRQKAWPLALSALGFASAAGISLYVTFAFGAGLAIWACVALARWREHLFPLIITGFIAVVLYLPFGLELRGASQMGKLPIALTIRAFTPIDYWLPSLIQPLKRHPEIVYALRFIFLPFNYLFELGFFLVSGLLFWRWRRSQNRPLAPEEVVLACVAAGSVLVCTFLRSTFRWNDLGWRGFLVAQFVLLLWAIPVAESLLNRFQPDPIPSRFRPLLWFCVWVGLAGTAGELGSMRINYEGPHGPDTTGWRDAYVWVDHNTPQNTVVLLDADVPLDIFSSLYGHRQTVAVGRAYATFFAVGSWSEKVLGDTVEFYRQDRPVNEVLEFCRRYGVGTIVVLSSDPIWNDRSSWVWNVKPSFSTTSAKVFRVAECFEASANSPATMRYP